ncbi:hypothetical protein AT15_04630 [Kosmotoga arenicorallina S304]|uniref:Calcineurin-like phosphoesterase domain-containing protein n=2 Tax=Kosmotoga arenicorallina TaxID=688066 RepID=A0A176JXF4_9BACT|nr:hypothetical protein AT15_04630 [Kosmotoga arenicorallina S304]
MFFLVASGVLMALIITSPASDSVQFSWYTGESIRCELEVYNDDFSTQATESNPSKFHVHNIGELKPDSNYHYLIRCNSSDEIMIEGSFSIPLNPGDEFEFAVYGDSRSNLSVHEKVVKTIAKKEPLFVIHTGDIVYSDNRLNDWEDFFKATEPFGSTLFLPVIGNHEKEARNYKAFFALPGNESYYSYRAGDLLFLMLNTNERFDRYSKQYKWLKSLLKSETAKFTIAVFHHPAFSYGSHGDSFFVKTILVPLFEKYGVDLVLTGHDHNYQRIEHNGITYIVTGGGGASLYGIKDLSGPTASFKGHHFVLFEYDSGYLKGICYDTNENVIDSFDLFPR